MLSARIANIQHFNVHDGPGFRTIVFFQGCSMKCRWCQNPETISASPRFMFDSNLCIGCRACINACPVGAISYEENTFITDYQKCTLCGRCVEECYPLARTLSSHEKTVDEVFDEVIKDKRAFLISAGGITLSGGEPLLHEEFITELLKRIKAEGVNTAVETAGNVPFSVFEKISPLVDTFLYDLKLFDSLKHRYWTGFDNNIIKNNLTQLSEIHGNIVIRIPLIPGVNDSDEEFTDMMKFVKTLRSVNSVHILPFHNLGSNKYTLLNERYDMIEHREDNAERIEACAKIASSFDLKCSIGGTGFVSDKEKMLAASGK